MMNFLKQYKKLIFHCFMMLLFLILCVSIPFAVRHDPDLCVFLPITELSSEMFFGSCVAYSSIFACFTIYFGIRSFVDVAQDIVATCKRNNGPKP